MPFRDENQRSRAFGGLTLAADVYGERLSELDYVAWHRTLDGSVWYPAGSTIRGLFGSWEEARVACFGEPEEPDVHLADGARGDRDHPAAVHAVARQDLVLA